MLRVTLPALLLLIVAAVPAAGQTPLTLAEAVSRARVQSAEVLKAEVRITRAGAEAREVRARQLPRVDVVESWNRADLPVFAFSSLLSQRRFSAADFDVARLNRPDAIDNYRAAVAVEQVVFDAGLSASVRRANLGREMATLEREQIGREMAVATIEAYGQVQRIDASMTAARAAVDAAEQDLARAIDRRDAGLATDADVLMVTVHLASAREREIQASSQMSVVRAQLNHLMGEPLDAAFDLTPIDVVDEGLPAVSSVEAEAVTDRADVRLAMAGERLADTATRAARAAFLPHVVARAAVEWNGAAFDDRTRGWMAGAEVRWTPFAGFAHRARLAQARAVGAERRLERAAAEDRARLDIRAASASLAAARARVDLSRAAVSAARESQRIVRDRYDNGLSPITDVLRAAQAAGDANAQAVAATSDLATAHARLQAALGKL